MANSEHLELINQGVEAWNEWREHNPEIEPDLSSADLHYGELENVDFSATNLSGADLSLASLRGAAFNCADLVNVQFYGADLTDTDFSYALLYNTDFHSAVLENAIFADAMLGGANFTDNDLSKVNGLEDASSNGPSSIGIDTIYKSRGNIPEKFLRGCGLPESFIVQIPALVAAMQPIQFYSCFISYSSKDGEFAKRLYNDLQSEGVRCWFAPEDLKIGDKFRVRIDESIRLYDKLILVLSENSVSSEWVGDEVEAALEKEEGQGGKVVLFPLRLDDAVMEIKEGWPAKVRRTRHIGDFSDWKSHDSYKKAFERLMRDLKAGEGR
ncbi:MAG: toll/interleukin-1 receptor domain-containing protein [Pyrinomonadaceae bacterium]